MTHEQEIERQHVLDATFAVPDIGYRWVVAIIVIELLAAIAVWAAKGFPCSV